MDIHISTSDGSPIYEQIARQIKGQILSGVLKPGDPLPQAFGPGAAHQPDYHPARL